MATEPTLYRITNDLSEVYEPGELVLEPRRYRVLDADDNLVGWTVPVEPEADELCPNHKSAYLFNFKTRKSYCAHCGEEVEKVSDE